MKKIFTLLSSHKLTPLECGSHSYTKHRPVVAFSEKYLTDYIGGDFRDNS